MTLCGQSKQWLENWVEGGSTRRSWRSFLVRSVVSSLFVASLVHLAHVFHAPLEVFPTTLIEVLARSSRAAEPASAAASGSLSQVALAVITKERFQKAYEGTSPLDRCVLQKDLGLLLNAPRLETAVIDLDLSPTWRNSGEHKEREDACQKSLDQLLDDFATKAAAEKGTASRTSARRLWLLDPIEEQSTAEATQWKQARERAGAVFVNGTQEASIGVVSKHRPGSLTRPSVGEALALRIGTLQDDDFCHTCEGYPIAFRHALEFHQHAVAHPLEDAALHKDMDEGVVTHLLIGARYSEDDRFLTPIGRLQGVELHAAIAAQPREQRGHWMPFLLDIFVGAFVFAGLIHFFWGRYFDARAPLIHDRHGGQATVAGASPFAYRELVWLAGSYLALTLVITAISALAYVHCDWVLNPIPMALGMALEGFVIGGVEIAEHRLLHHLPAQARQAELPRWGRLFPLSWALAHLPCMAYAVVVGVTLFKLVFDHCN